MIVLCLVLLMSACSDGDDQQVSDEATIPADTGPTAEPAPTELDPADEQDDDAATPEPTSPAPASPEAEVETLASTTLPVDWVDGGEMEAEVKTLEVTGELLRMTMTFTASLPETAEDVDLGAVLYGENAPGAAVAPALIDPVHLKAYELVSGGTANGVAVPLTDGVPRTMVFYYAAPVDDVETLDVHLASTVAPITDVPLSP